MIVINRKFVVWVFGIPAFMLNMFWLVELIAAGVEHLMGEVSGKTDPSQTAVLVMCLALGITFVFNITYIVLSDLVMARYFLDKEYRP